MLKKQIYKFTYFLIKSILAGIMIGIGGTIFLSLDDKIIGSFMFAIGLFIIVSFSLNLFTGKVGYIFNNKPKYLVEVFLTLIGNFIGTFITGYVLSLTRISNVLFSKAQIMCKIKLNDSLLSIFLLAIFCGLLMYIAVNGYKTITNSIGKNIIVFLSVAVFILCGFEHSIADMFYFTIANMYSSKTLLYLTIIIFGNATGGVIIPLSNKLCSLLED